MAHLVVAYEDDERFRGLLKRYVLRVEGIYTPPAAPSGSDRWDRPRAHAARDGG